MLDAFKHLISAIERSGKDLMAFAVVMFLTVWALISGVDTVSAIATGSIFIVLWVVMRYALVRIQVSERLQELKEGASVRSKEILEARANSKELAELNAPFGQAVATDD